MDKHKKYSYMAIAGVWKPKPGKYKYKRIPLHFPDSILADANGKTIYYSYFRRKQGVRIDRKFGAIIPASKTAAALMDNWLKTGTQKLPTKNAEPSEGLEPILTNVECEEETTYVEGNCWWYYPETGWILGPCGEVNVCEEAPVGGGGDPWPDDGGGDWGDPGSGGDTGGGGPSGGGPGGDDGDPPCGDPIHGCAHEDPPDLSDPCNSFEDRVAEVLDVEGGYKNDPTDPGDPTNKGISWPTWQDHAQDVLGVEPTLQNLQDLTESQAEQIYKEKYWDRVLADQINDGDLRFLLFDFYVNAGENAIEVLQRTLNNLGHNISVDGDVGSETISALNNHNNQVELYNTYKEKRQNYYDSITSLSYNDYADDNPSATNEELEENTFAKYIDGWTNRVDSFANKTQSDSTNVNC